MGWQARLSIALQRSGFLCLQGSDLGRSASLVMRAVMGTLRSFAPAEGAV